MRFRGQDLLSGESRDVASVALRAVLRPFGAAFGAVVRCRRWAYRHGVLPSASLGVPVVSVGNLVLGGTGKTPFVRFLLDALTRAGRRASVLSRGYGSRPEGESLDEEGALVASRHPGHEVVQGARRERAFRARPPGPLPDVVLLDDGFQHLRIRRDLDIVLLDAARPFGSGRVLPAGDLREPAAALAMADVVILTRADEADTEQARAAARRILRLTGGVPVLRAVHRPVAVPDLAGRRALLVSGIARPRSLERTARALGIDVADHIAFPDHHGYDGLDAAAIGLAAERAGAGVVVTTEKDGRKLRPFAERLGRPLREVAIEIAFLDDPAPVLDRILALAGRPAEAPVP